MKVNKKSILKKRISTLVSLGVLFALINIYIAYFLVIKAIDINTLGYSGTDLLVISKISIDIFGKSININDIIRVLLALVLFLPSLFATILSIVYFLKRKKDDMYIAYFIFNLFIFISLFFYLFINKF